MGGQQDKEIVAFTIFRVVLDSLKMLATICPFAAEEMYQNFKKAFGLKEESVHLLDWPIVSESLVNVQLEMEIETAESVIQSILAGREKIQRGVRWPVREVIIVTKDNNVRENIKKTEAMIKSQTNVKSIKMVDRLESIKNVVKSDFKTLGPEFGETAAKIIGKLTQESADTILQHIEKDGLHKIEVDGKTFELKKEHLILERISPDNLQESSFRQGFVYLDKRMDESLEAEGFSRELMRRVQSLRKKSGLEKKDSIALVVKQFNDLNTGIR